MNGEICQPEKRSGALAAQETRRGVLAAAGGFVLAASGLLLPAWLEGTAARDGALGGAKGGRHGKNHRGRDQRHNHSHKRHRDRLHNGAGEILKVALNIGNSRQTEVSVRAWKFLSYCNGPYDCDDWWEPMTDWLKLDAKPASGEGAVIYFFSDSPELAVEIVEINMGRRVIKVWNPLIGWPEAIIGVGAWSREGWYPQGETLMDKGFSQGETAKVSGIHVTRADDSSSHKRFIVDLV